MYVMYRATQKNATMMEGISDKNNTLKEDLSLKLKCSISLLLHIYLYALQNIFYVSLVGVGNLKFRCSGNWQFQTIVLRFYLRLVRSVSNVN